LFAAAQRYHCSMEGKFNDAELLYIREVLYQHGDYLVDLLTDDIESKNIRDKDDLLNSISFNVTNYGIDQVLQFSFMSYGRALEIRYHKRSSNTKAWATDTNKVVWGNGRTKKRKRKNVLFYTRNVFGSQNRLISMLSNEFNEHEQARIKQILDRQKIQLPL
jgi:hypothetical protein